MALPGCGMVLGSLWWGAASVELLQSGLRAEGTVVRMVQSTSTDTDGSTSTSYKPEYTFEDARGVEHVVLSGVGTNPPAYTKGDRVEVLYFEHDVPGTAEINAFFPLWGGPLILMLMGSGFVVAGGLAFRNSNPVELDARMANALRDDVLDGPDGRKIDTVITAVEGDVQSGFVIVSERHERQYRSARLFVSPEHPEQLEGEVVEVSVSATDPDVYRVHHTPLLARHPDFR